MKVNQAKVEVFNNADPAALQAAVNAWLEARGQESFISIQFTESTGSFTAYVVYTQ